MAEFVQTEEEKPFIMKVTCILRLEKAKKAAYFGVVSCIRVDAMEELHLKVLVLW